MQKFGKIKHIHFVGIGGIGMSGIAELLLNLGYEVSGSDLNETPVTERLSALGGRIYRGHHTDHVKGADVVVYSSAVRLENPEIMGAKDHYVPVIPRAEMLAELMRLKFGIAVAGAHGKTTTTSMIASILTAAQLDPTVVIGGRLDIWGGSNAKLGQGEILLAEADESDGSFLALSPTITVVTNIDCEHMDHYGSMDAIRKTFIDFINKIPFYGTSVLCLDNEEIQTIIPRLKKRYLTYGMTSQADLRAKDVRKRRMGVDFEVVYKNESLGRISLGMPGEHNVLNGLAAIGVGLELDLDVEVIKKGLIDLGGVSRRFQIKGEEKSILVVDDYGHHPAEIMATLKTAKDCWPDRRLIVIFQPHRYTRTHFLFDRFVLSFNEAEVLILVPIYSAGEEPMSETTGEKLAKGIKEHGHKDVVYCEGNQAVFTALAQMLKPGDVVMTLGAGDIYHLADELMTKIRSGNLPLVQR